MSSDNEVKSEMKNLDLLLEAADAISELVKRGESQLNMSHYNARDGVKVFVKPEDIKQEHCGTSACFAGHMPFLGIPGLRPTEGDFREGVLRYPLYIKRLFNIRGKSWLWLFSSYAGNDIDLLVKRVEYFYTHQSPPPKSKWCEFGFTDIIPVG